MGAPRKGPESARKLETYPYTIPPTQCPDKKMADECDPWETLEFFRIEALLRSNVVFQLYRSTIGEEVSQPDELRKQFHIVEGWEVLKKAHHCYLDPHDGRVMVKIYKAKYDVGGSVVDLSGMAEVTLEEAAYYANLILHRDEDGPRAVLLAIDPASPPEATIKQLRPYLQRLYKPYKGEKKLHDLFLNRRMKRKKVNYNVKASSKIDVMKIGDRVSIPRERMITGGGVTRFDERGIYQTYKDPPIKGYRGIKTWLEYFRCYDLRTTQPLSFGEIGKQVYGMDTRQTYERAEQGFKRVRQLIRYAEQKDWPPPPIR